MSIFRTAYETQACQGFQLAQVRDGLEKALISSGALPGAGGAHEIRGINPIELAIPAFAHPIEYGKPSHPHEALLAVDMRAYGRWDARQAEYVLRNHPDYNLAQLRGQLNYLWLTQGPAVLRDLSPLAVGQYAEFISKNVARRFALNPKETQDLAILSGWFYLSCHTDDHQLNERDRARMVQAIARGTRVSAEDVFLVTDQLEGPIHAEAGVSAVSAFCKAMETVTQSVRLRDFNVGVLYQLLTGAWFGTNAAEIIAAAIEHPPTWIALLAVAIEERTFKKSGLTQQVARAQQDMTRQFIHSTRALLGNHFESHGLSGR
jgi:hypothetical protein